MTISVNLMEGGALTNPDICPESLLDCESRTLSSNGLGSQQFATNAPWLRDHIRQAADCSMYPSPDMDPKWVPAVEAAKPTPSRAPNRWLDFRAVEKYKAIVSGLGKGWANQAQLHKWYRENRAAIVACQAAGEDMLFWSNRIPQQTDFQHLYWEVGNPGADVTFDIVTANMDTTPHSVETVLVADVDGSVKGSGFFDIPRAMRWRHDVYLKIGIRIKTFKAPADPAAENPDCDDYEKTVLDDFAVMITPYYNCPHTGR